MGINGNTAFITNQQFDNLNLGTRGQVQLSINDEGHLGINETTPEMMLHIKQDVDNKGIRIEHQTAGDFWETGIGLSSKNYKFFYNGVSLADIASVDGSYLQYSDRRLKRDIQELPAVLERVNQLKPASYLYDANAEDGPRSIGLVAQDVEPLFPELVRETDQGFKGLVYDGFAVISIKAIQELNDEILKLKSEVKDLRRVRANVSQLKADFEQLKKVVNMK